MKLVISAAVLTALAVAPAMAQSSSSSPSSPSMGSSSGTSSGMSGSAGSGTAGSAAMGADQSATWEGNSTLVRQVEQKLKDQGFTVGSIDGKLDESERSTIKQFQDKKGISQSGKIDQATLSALDISPQTAASPSGSMSGSGSTTPSSPAMPPSGSTSR